MQFKYLQKKLKSLSARVKSNNGAMSKRDHDELQKILHETLTTANEELHGVQEQLRKLVIKRANDNASLDHSQVSDPINDNGLIEEHLTEEQQIRLSVIEKTGTGSTAVH